MIQFNNLNRQYADIREEIESAIVRVLRSGWFILGEELDAFEKEFKKYVGCKHCLGVGSGTDAIALSIIGLGIGRGHEVITSDMTAFPTIAGIMQSGATPVVVDISPDDGLIDASSIEKKINKKTKAILPVHLYGQSCDMEAVRKIADSNDLKVIEDCAQSVGATFKHKRTGSLGDVGAFSFYPTKNLGAYGDSGAIVLDDEEIYQKLLRLRNYGQTDRYHHEEYGVNSRLDEVQAAILRVKLRHLEEWNNKRREHACYYQQQLNGVSFLKENSYGVPVYHLFPIRSTSRDRLMDYLSSHDIQSFIHYPLPIHKQNAFHRQKKEAFPHTERFAEEILSIPLYPELREEEREKIVRIINEFRR
jgi:dTDP-4-amino-4,6-dideoxygalactose transaminase